MNFSRWVLGGVVAGLIGAAIWAGVAYALEVEIGWIAWLIGILVGVGVRMAAGGDTEKEVGWTAAVIALLAIAAGKFAAVELHVSNVAWADVFTVTPESGIAQIAAQIMSERMEEGEAFPPPGAKRPEDLASIEQLFPRDVWQEATRRWSRLGPEAQRVQLADLETQAVQARDSLKGVARREGFLASFSPYDILWALLAVGSAFKIATAPQSNQGGQRAAAA